MRKKLDPKRFRSGRDFIERSTPEAPPGPPLPHALFSSPLSLCTEEAILPLTIANTLPLATASGPQGVCGGSVCLFSSLFFSEFLSHTGSEYSTQLDISVRQDYV